MSSGVHERVEGTDWPDHIGALAEAAQSACGAGAWVERAKWWSGASHVAQQLTSRIHPRQTHDCAHACTPTLDLHAAGPLAPNCAPMGLLAASPRRAPCAESRQAAWLAAPDASHRLLGNAGRRAPCVCWKTN